MENGRGKVKTPAKHEPTSGHRYWTQALWNNENTWYGPHDCAQYTTSTNIYTTSTSLKPPKCECGAEKEIVDHYLLNCELYDEERDALRRSVGAQKMRTNILLGTPK